jgi:hypothetical protein
MDVMPVFIGFLETTVDGYRRVCRRNTAAIRLLADAPSDIDETASCSLVMASPELKKWTADATRL